MLIPPFVIIITFNLIKVNSPRGKKLNSKHFIFSLHYVSHSPLMSPSLSYLNALKKLQSKNNKQ